MKDYRLITYLLVVWIYAQGIAQVNPVQFDRISIEDGLSQNSVYAIFKDSRGFIWFGTAEGLNRFDGFNFAVYKMDPDNPASISDSWVTCIFEDSRHNLWIGTDDGGLNIYDYEKENFIRFSYNAGMKGSLSDNSINDMAEDKDGFLWIATNSGLNKLNLKTLVKDHPGKQHFEVFSKANTKGWASDEVLDIFITAGNEIWLGTYGGGLISMNHSDRGAVSLKAYRHEPGRKQSPCSDDVWSICEDKADENILWIANSHDLEKFNKKTGHFVHSNQMPAGYGLFVDVRTMISDYSGNLWIGTKNQGLIKKDFKTGSFHCYRNNAGDISTLSRDNVLSLFEDNEGILWAGTKGGGVNRKRIEKFTHYKRLPGNPGTLSANSIWALYKDRKGTIWAGTEEGLNRLDRGHDRFELFQTNTLDPQSLSDNSIYAIYEDHRGDFWIGTSGGGLNLMDRNTGRCKRYLPDTDNPGSLSHDFVRTIAEDAEGNLWIGTRGGGLNKLNRKRENFTVYRHRKDNPNSLSHDRINSLIIDHDGIVWIATSGGGLNRFDPKTDSFRCFTVDSSSPGSINDIYVMALCEDSKGRLWVGTYSGGLNLFDKNSEKFTHYTIRDGLPNNLIYGILEDNQGKIWLSTNKGLSSFNPASGTFENFDVSDGLQDMEFNAGACYKGSDGELLFGGINGFNILRPQDIQKNTVVPPIVITDFKVINKKVNPGGNSLLKKSIITTNEIKLSYRDYFFSLEFAALSYVSNLKNKYKYKLEGFDKDWIETDFRNRIATYTNLRGGKYIFRVIASNNDGIWNDTGAAIKLTIEPPFWQTLGFRISAVIILALGLVAFYRYRVHALEKQKKLLESAVMEKNREVVQQKVELEMINQKLTFYNEELQIQREELQIAIKTLKEAHFKLVQSEKMASLGVLLAGVAHEINNPLNFILGGYNGLNNIIKESGLSDGRTEIFLDAIKTGVDRATGIVNGLNLFSRNNEGIHEECDVHSILDSSLAIINYQLNNRIELIRNSTAESVLVNGNVGKLHQVFINVLTNAVHAIANEGIISVVTRRENKSITIEITDNGCGISEADLPRITDPFFTTKDPGKGTGLGLSIVYSIIQEHKGNLHIYSELGKGTTIIIELPTKNNHYEKA